MPDRETRPQRISFEVVRLPNRRSAFEGKLLRATEELIVLAQPIAPSKPLVVGGEEVMGPGYGALWFLFKGQNFDVGRIYRPDGSFTGYYVDILEIVEWTGSDPATLKPLVDLFLDLWITPDRRFRVLDEGELEEAQRTGAISRWDARQARNEMKELIESIRAGTFPPQVVRELRPSPAEVARIMDSWKT